MKKTLIFLGLIALSANIFSMQKEQNYFNPKKQQLTKSDKIKVGAALFGASFFIWATLLNPYAKLIDKRYGQENVPINLETIQYLPSFIAYAPSRIIHNLLKQSGKKGFSLSTTYNISTAYSSILACLFGLYAYKKLIESKNEKNKNS